MTADFAALILAGGRGRRLGGADKAALRLGERTTLDRAVSATAAAREIVVLGDRLETARMVRFVRESPPFAGPAAAIVCGLGALAASCPQVVVLAVDMPWVTTATIARLLSGSDSAGDGAVLADSTGRQQLAMAIHTEALTSVAAQRSDWSGQSMRELLRPLDLRLVPAQGREGRDIDTPLDLAAFRQDGESGWI